MSWLYTVLFAGLLISSQDNGVSSVDVNFVEVPPAAVSTQDETEKFEQSYPLNADGRVRVSNVNGPITIEGWDRNEVRLSYTKIADTRERLSEVEVKIDARPDYFRVESDYIENRMRSREGWRNSGRLTVEYRLMVPRGAVLNEIETVNGSVAVSNFTNITRVSAVNGSVKAGNIRGTARLSTVNGEVNADFDRLESGSKISLDTVNGKVFLTIPSDSNATLKADSVNGSITNDFGLPVRRGKYVGRDLYGRLGSGDVNISLNSVNGTLSIGRRNDGRPAAPATNLLPQTRDDEDSWVNFDPDLSAVNSAKINKEVEKAVKNSSKIAEKELADVHKSLAKMGPEIARLTAESVKLATENLSAEEFARKIAQAQIAQEKMSARLGDIAFSPGIPRVEKKSGSFPVKGVPKVTVDAKGCSVSVRGWDKNDVQYRVTQFSRESDKTPLDIKDTHSDSAVNITVANGPNPDSGMRFFPDQTRIRIEIYVPKKSNLKINAGGEIRIEGVSGEVDLTGVDQSINVRDVDGKLKVVSADGRVRVIGFSGDLDVQSVEGSMNLEGDFHSLNARTREGAVVLTFPETASADLDVTGGTVRGDGINVTRMSGDENRGKYRIRDGGRSFKVASDGEIIVRSAGLLADMQ